MKKTLIILLISFFFILIVSCSVHRKGYKKARRKRNCDCPRFSELPADTLIINFTQSF